MAVHPHDPETVYILPLESDMFRCVPEAKLRVYQTKDGGSSWKPLTRGLPQKGAYETILRDAMTTNTHEAAGIYFGTRSGKVFGSNDGGASWMLIADGLPPVVCVKSATLGDGARGARKSTSAAKSRSAKPGEAKSRAAKPRGAKASGGKSRGASSRGASSRSRSSSSRAAAPRSRR